MVYKDFRASFIYVFFYACIMHSSKFKYHKLFLLFLAFLIAYFLFLKRDALPVYRALSPFGYFGTFISGVMFTYGFTAPIASAIFLILSKEQNIFLAGVIGGLGALIGDLLIFKLIRHSFSDEIKKLSKERVLVKINSKIPRGLRAYLILILGGFIIASPLPDEIGIALLAGYKHISVKFFSVISYFLNTMGIFVILLFGRII